MAITTTDAASTLDSLLRRASNAAAGANRPIHTTGNVVSSPSCVALSPNSETSWSTSGGTEVMTGRRLLATSASANSHQPAKASVGGRVTPRPRLRSQR
jgi:hypothetical protein